MKPEILIVDDEVAFAQILTDRLSMLVYQPYIALPESRPLISSGKNLSMW